VEENNTKSLAQFLLKHNEKLSKEQLGELLSGKNADDVVLITAFAELLDFTGDGIDQALRKFLTKFMLPGEAQKIDRIVEVFASQFHKCNPTSFPSKDAAYIVAFSLIMLNTDRHNPAIAEKDKMMKEDFIRNLRGMWDGEDPPRELLSQLYDNICNDEIQMRMKGDPDKKGWVKSIKGGSYEQGRRWVCLVGNELRWYKEPTLGKGDRPVLGKIVLDWMMVREEEDRFEIAASIPKNINFSTYEKGKETPASCRMLVITCENDMRMENWANAVRANVTFDASNVSFSSAKAIKKLPKTKGKKGVKRKY